MNDARAWQAYFNGDSDARRLTLTPILCLSLLYGHFTAGVLGWVPLWTFCLSAPILVVRWMLATHELMHIRSAGEVDWVTRLMPLLLTPLSLGYREQLEMHRGHHRYMATPQDPEYYQLHGNKLQGLAGALTAPEQAFFRWLGREGMDAELVLGATVRAALFALLAYAAGTAFWWYWIPVRLAFGASYFAFFYALHRRGKEHGVYRVMLPVWFAKLFALLFGREALLATTFHDIHHAQPRISAFHLPTVAQDLPKDGLSVE